MIPNITIKNSTDDGFKKAVIKFGNINLVDFLLKLEAAFNKSKEKMLVTDIETLTSSQLDSLKCGDQVIKRTGTEEHCYTVAYKDDTKHEIALVYCDAWNVEEVYYDKSVGGAWSMIEKKVTAIATQNS